MSERYVTTFGTESITDDPTQPGGALASAAASPNRLLFATPVLTTPVHLSGTTQVSITLSSSKPAANLSVWLVALPWPSGQATNNEAGIITRGWADPANARSLRTTEPLVPGKPVTVSFDLEPDDQIIPAGKRIGPMIFIERSRFHPLATAGHGADGGLGQDDRDDAGGGGGRGGAVD